MPSWCPRPAPPNLRARTPGTDRCRTRRLSPARLFRQWPAQWHSGANAHATGADRPSRGTGCSQIGRRPGGIALAAMACSRQTPRCARLPSPSSPRPPQCSGSSHLSASPTNLRRLPRRARCNAHLGTPRSASPSRRNDRHRGSELPHEGPHRALGTARLQVATARPSYLLNFKAAVYLQHDVGGNTGSRYGRMTPRRFFGRPEMPIRSPIMCLDWRRSGHRRMSRSPRGSGTLQRARCPGRCSIGRPRLIGGVEGSRIL